MFRFLTLMGRGTSETLYSSASVAVVNVNDDPTGSILLSGSLIEDQTLSTSLKLVDNDGLGEVSYGWEYSSDASTWSTISGAASDSLTLGDNEVGNYVRLKASYTDGHGTNEIVYSQGAHRVVNKNDLPTGAVTLSGTVTEDQILTADSSTLSDADGLGSVSLQWQAENSAGVWADISGATSASPDPWR